MSSLRWNSELETRAMHYDIAPRHILLTVFVVDNAISIIYSAFVSVALIIQHADYMHHAIFTSVACPTLQNLFTFSHKLHYFFKKILNIMCVF
jgi:hypothetical protein